MIKGDIIKMDHKIYGYITDLEYTGYNTVIPNYQKILSESEDVYGIIIFHNDNTVWISSSDKNVLTKQFRAICQQHNIKFNDIILCYFEDTVKTGLYRALNPSGIYWNDIKYKYSTQNDLYKSIEEYINTLVKR